MKTILIILSLITSSISLVSQHTFLKQLDLGELTTARQMVYYEGRIFALVTGVCDGVVECSVYVELNEDGDILWQKKLRWLDAASKSMVIENDTIYISGNHPSSEKWLWHQMSVDGGDSLATYEIFEPGNIYNRMFNLGQVKYQDHFCIYGPGNRDDRETCLLYFVDQQGKLDTLVELFTTGVDTDPWEVIPDHEGNLVAFIWYREEGKDRQRVVAKINADKDLVWAYFSEQNSMQDAVPNGAILVDGTIVYNSREQFNRAEKLRGIGPDSTIVWSHDPNNVNGEGREYTKVMTMAEGDILGVGSFYDINVDPMIEEVPWITKVADTGDMVWERAYYAFRENGRTQWGKFRDAIELDDGSILVLGHIRPLPGEAKDVIVARLDSDGCLHPDCSVYNDITDIVSGLAELQQPSIHIYPNPVEGILHVEADQLVAKTEIYDVSGRCMIAKEGKAEIDVSALPAGMYVLKVLVGIEVSVIKFIKI